MQRFLNPGCQDKKRRMKKNILLLLFIIMAASACKKNNGSGIKNSTGVITSMSSEKCACCWGWNITIGGENYRFEKIPASAPFDLENITYPTTVNIEWQNSHTGCDGIIIVVLAISKK